MKRDWDLLRELLLKIEAAKQPSFEELMGSGNSNSELDSAAYQMRMLIDDAMYVRGVDANYMGGHNWLNLELTWQRHEFLDNVRDPEIWSKTKAGAKKAGNLSVDVLGALAKGFIKEKIKKHTGVEIEL
jgi:hypothetical protein